MFIISKPAGLTLLDSLKSGDQINQVSSVLRSKNSIDLNENDPGLFGKIEYSIKITVIAYEKNAFTGFETGVGQASQGSCYYRKTHAFFAGDSVTLVMQMLHLLMWMEMHVML